MCPDFQLRVSTPRSWAPIALSDFNTFLIDHAKCERKASALGMSLVCRYPDRPKILESLIQFAREELQHFHQVFRLLLDRDLTMTDDEEDHYVKALLMKVRHGRDERLLDRLVISSLIEARGTERLGLVTEAITDTKLKTFYGQLTRAEEHHRGLFLELAREYYSPSAIEERVDFFLDVEATAITSVPFRSALH